MDGGVTIREFVWDDYPAIIALWHTVFGGTRAEDARATLAVTVARNPGLFVVAEQDGQVVGTVIGTWDGRRGFLYHVAVAPTMHRQGVGQALIQTVTDRLVALGVQRIHLRVDHENAGAIAFYRRLGFVRDDESGVVGMRIVMEGD